ncbi:MAG: hypothetical protein IIC24_02070 [Chloroflexi bacterium]|nr:hypothetical protein [Chloroflexota bacterium]
MPDNNHRLGEVIEASTTEFTIQSYELYDAPPLGSLVRCGSSEVGVVYGIVFEVATRSLDSARRPIARGRDEDSEAAIYQENPQLSRLLTTEFRALTVGYLDDETLRRWLAPLPPRIHSFVRSCHGDELREFSKSLEFVPILLSAPTAATDDVLAAFLRQASESYPEPETFLIEAGRQLTPLLGDQLHRLNNLLQRLAP